MHNQGASFGGRVGAQLIEHAELKEERRGSLGNGWRS